MEVIFYKDLKFNDFSIALDELYFMFISLDITQIWQIFPTLNLGEWVVKSLRLHVSIWSGKDAPPAKKVAAELWNLWKPGCGLKLSAFNKDAPHYSNWPLFDQFASTEKKSLNKWWKQNIRLAKNSEVRHSCWGILAFGFVLQDLLCSSICGRPSSPLCLDCTPNKNGGDFLHTLNIFHENRFFKPENNMWINLLLKDAGDSGAATSSDLLVQQRILLSRTAPHRLSPLHPNKLKRCGSLVLLLVQLTPS